MQIFKANKQWATRPADERFPTIQALYDATRAYAQEAKTKDVAVADLRVEAAEGDVNLVGKQGIPARFTHWAFGQLCRRLSAPADFLRELPPTLASQVLNNRLANLTGKVEDAVSSLLFHANGGLLLRAITSDKYQRVWNHEVAERLLGLEGQGWKPATPDRVLVDESELGVTALYASDHDMFAFVKHSDAVVKEAGSTEPLYRGLIVENSEVGASALKVTRFLYRYMCENHIIWGASEVGEVALRHVGSVKEKFNLWYAEAKRYAEESVSDEEAKIAAAKSKLIGASKEEVLDALFGKRSLGLSRKTLDGGYEAIVPEQDGDPNTVWGFVQGLTRYSQLEPYADARTAIDKAAGKVLEAFAF